jgi:uncharacterized membrane protein YoaK (UPF0700 family)
MKLFLRYIGKNIKEKKDVVIMGIWISNIIGFLLGSIWVGSLELFYVSFSIFAIPIIGVLLYAIVLTAHKLGTQKVRNYRIWKKKQEGEKPQ